MKSISMALSLLALTVGDEVTPMPITPAPYQNHFDIVGVISLLVFLRDRARCWCVGQQEAEGRYGRGAGSCRKKLQWSDGYYYDGRYVGVRRLPLRYHAGNHDEGFWSGLDAGSLVLCRVLLLRRHHLR